MIDRTDRETLPPAAPDDQAAAFERLVRERGEARARWDRLMALLAPQDPDNGDAVRSAMRDVCRPAGVAC